MLLRNVTGIRVSGLALTAGMLLCSLAMAQTDPGPRPGASTTGNPIPGLAQTLLSAFNLGLNNFQEVEDVTNDGLGPRFNSNSCVSCHVQPAPGGTSPAVNPQMQFANSVNRLPSFITQNGPAREARFIRKSDGSADGGVHALFTIGGRADTPSGCNLVQEDFSNASNISLRVATPTFGLGFVEAIPDATLVQNLAQNAAAKAALGIGGKLNHNGNDGTIARFGWKAQNKSLLLFAAEAYNVEMGISNLVFNTERDETTNCSPIAAPNSMFNLGGFMDQAVFDDINNFANFMRFLDVPARGPITNSVTQGSNQFFNIGCANCHTVTLRTGASPVPQLANKEIHPYSDFAVHHMGPGLADQVSQGQAGGDEFRSAPLWGVGQRIFFLHDGRTSNIVQAILAHASPGNGQFPASEANAVIRNFLALGASDRQAIVDFLRSL